MNAFKMKLLLLPLLGMGVVAGVSQFSTVGKSSKGANLGVIVAASNRAQLAEDDSDKDDDEDDKKDREGDEVQARVARFWEGKELIIDDGKGRISVDYNERWKPLNLKVGQPVAIRGSISGSGSQRTLTAYEIRGPQGVVYPQQTATTQVRADGLGPFLSENHQQAVQPQQTADGSLYMIREVMEKSPMGEEFVIKGEIVEIPEESLLILRDSSGQISVNIADALQSINLQKGDKVTIKGSLNDKKEVEASKIEKN